MFTMISSFESLRDLLVPNIQLLMVLEKYDTTNRDPTDMNHIYMESSFYINVTSEWV